MSNGDRRHPVMSSSRRRRVTFSHSFGSFLRLFRRSVYSLSLDLQGGASTAAAASTAVKSPGELRAISTSSWSSASKSLSSSPSSTGLPQNLGGLALDEMERARRGVRGLLPPAVTDTATEVRRGLAALDQAGTKLDKYRVLMSLAAEDPATFRAIVTQGMSAKVLPVIYTPGVGDACLQWGIMQPRPKGLYISTKDKGNVRKVVDSWPHDTVKVAVITDGERILGLGDLGAHGMGISIGKGLLYTAAAGLPAEHILPVCLDVGCNNSEYRDDEFYVGLRQPRVRGEAYDAFLDEVLDALRARFGPKLVLHFEDFGPNNAFRVLHKAQSLVGPCFNDDIQSTAAITLGALLGATQLPFVPPLKEQKILLFGAGQANLGFARLLALKLVKDGVARDEDDARRRIWLMDSKGLIYAGRGNLTGEKQVFAHPLTSEPDLAAHVSNGNNNNNNGEPAASSLKDLEAVVRALKPTALIGASTVRGSFSRPVLEALKGSLAARSKKPGPNLRPVVMALSNPDNKAECTAQEAVDFYGPDVVFASGTVFPPVKLPRGRNILVQGQQQEVDYLTAAQANNALIYPGLALGCIAAQAEMITDQLFLAAAEAAARETSKEELAAGAVLPRPDRIADVAIAVAERVAEMAALENLLRRETTTTTTNKDSPVNCVTEALGAGKKVNSCLEHVQMTKTTR